MPKMIHVNLGAESTPFGHEVTLAATHGDALEAKRLQHQIFATLAEQPRWLLCDLTAIPTVSTEVLDVLRAVVRQQADWPGTPVGIACPDRRLPGRLRGAAGHRVEIGTSVDTVAETLAGTPGADHATLMLAPGLTSPRSARAFVARACLRWDARAITGHAVLVASELVTDAVLHSDTKVQLVVSRHPGRLRIAVRDETPNGGARWGSAGVSGSGRGLLLVSSVCRAWAVQPTLDNAKVVWAVLDDAGS
ncbi:MAG: ATP-binding protein [Nocardioidaceae bacterium]